jgi:hypothetical protein
MPHIFHGMRLERQRPAGNNLSQIDASIKALPSK